MRNAEGRRRTVGHIDVFILLCLIVSGEFGGVAAGQARPEGSRKTHTTGKGGAKQSWHRDNKAGSKNPSLWQKLEDNINGWFDKTEEDHVPWTYPERIPSEEDWEHIMEEDWPDPSDAQEDEEEVEPLQGQQPLQLRRSKSRIGGSPFDDDALEVTADEADEQSTAEAKKSVPVPKKWKKAVAKTNEEGKEPVLQVSKEWSTALDAAGDQRSLQLNKEMNVVFSSYHFLNSRLTKSLSSTISNTATGQSDLIAIQIARKAAEADKTSVDKSSDEEKANEGNANLLARYTTQGCSVYAVSGAQVAKQFATFLYEKAAAMPRTMKSTKRAGRKCMGTLASYMECIHDQFVDTNQSSSHKNDGEGEHDGPICHLQKRPWGSGDRSVGYALKEKIDSFWAPAEYLMFLWSVMVTQKAPGMELNELGFPLFPQAENVGDDYIAYIKHMIEEVVELQEAVLRIQVLVSEPQIGISIIATLVNGHIGIDQLYVLCEFAEVPKAQVDNVLDTLGISRSSDIYLAKFVELLDSDESKVDSDVADRILGKIQPMFPLLVIINAGMGSVFSGLFENDCKDTSDPCSTAIIRVLAKNGFNRADASRLFPIIFGRSKWKMGVMHGMTLEKLTDDVFSMLDTNRDGLASLQEIAQVRRLLLKPVENGEIVEGFKSENMFFSRLRFAIHRTETNIRLAGNAQDLDASRNSLDDNTKKRLLINQKNAMKAIGLAIPKSMTFRDESMDGTEIVTFTNAISDLEYLRDLLHWFDEGVATRLISICRRVQGRAMTYVTEKLTDLADKVANAKLSMQLTHVYGDGSDLASNSPRVAKLMKIVKENSEYLTCLSEAVAESGEEDPKVKCNGAEDAVAELASRGLFLKSEESKDGEAGEGEGLEDEDVLEKDLKGRIQAMTAEGYQRISDIRDKTLSGVKYAGTQASKAKDNLESFDKLVKGTPMGYVGNSLHGVASTGQRLANETLDEVTKYEVMVQEKHQALQQQQTNVANFTAEGKEMLERLLDSDHLASDDGPILEVMKIVFVVSAYFYYLVLNLAAQLRRFTHNFGGPKSFLQDLQQQLHVSISKLSEFEWDEGGINEDVPHLTFLERLIIVSIAIIYCLFVYLCYYLWRTRSNRMMIGDDVTLHNRVLKKITFYRRIDFWGLLPLYLMMAGAFLRIFPTLYNCYSTVFYPSKSFAKCTWPVMNIALDLHSLISGYKFLFSAAMYYGEVGGAAHVMTIATEYLNRHPVVPEKIEDHHINSLWIKIFLRNYIFHRERSQGKTKIQEHCKGVDYSEMAHVIASDNRLRLLLQNLVLLTTQHSMCITAKEFGRIDLVKEYVEWLNDIFINLHSIFGGLHGIEVTKKLSDEAESVRALESNQANPTLAAASA